MEDNAPICKRTRLSQTRRLEEFFRMQKDHKAESEYNKKFPEKGKDKNLILIDDDEDSSSCDSDNGGKEDDDDDVKIVDEAESMGSSSKIHVGSSRKIYVDKGKDISEGEEVEVFDVDVGKIFAEKRGSSSSGGGSRESSGLWKKNIAPSSGSLSYDDIDDDDGDDDGDNDYYASLEDLFSSEEETDDNGDDPDYDYDYKGEGEQDSKNSKGKRGKEVKVGSQRKKDVEKENNIGATESEDDVQIEEDMRIEFEVPKKRKRGGNEVKVVSRRRKDVGKEVEDDAEIKYAEPEEVVGKQFEDRIKRKKGGKEVKVGSKRKKHVGKEKSIGAIELEDEVEIKYTELEEDMGKECKDRIKRKKARKEVNVKRKKDVGKEKSIGATKSENGAEMEHKEPEEEMEKESEVRFKRNRGDRKGNNVHAVIIDSEDEMDQDDDSQKDCSGHVVERLNSIGKRTRSHSDSAEGEAKNESCLNESDSRHSGSGEKSDGWNTSFDNVPNVSDEKPKGENTSFDYVPSGGGEEPEGESTSFPEQKSAEPVESGMSTKTKNRRGRKSENFINIMVNSILENGEECLEEEKISSDDNVPKTTLPLKFTFGVEESTECEKTEEEEELDKLWEDLAFALASSEIGHGSNKVEDEEFVHPEEVTDIAVCCSRGDHQYVLDDEVGLKCRYCFFVKTDIKNVMPDFCPDIWETSGKRRYAEKDQDQSFFSGLEHDDLDCDIGNGCSPAPAKGTIWDIIPGVRNTMYPHQRDGFEFVWRKTAGDIYLDKLKDSGKIDSGGGCIISHAPGTGKTRLTIVYLQTYMKMYPMGRPVIIAPTSMLLTWEEEFRKWKVDIPFHNLNHSEPSQKEDPLAIKLLLKSGTKLNVEEVRMLKLYSWKKGNSILGISYSLFEKLTNEGAYKNSQKKNDRAEQYKKILLELPGIIVFDEGHTPRNDQSCIFKSVSKIKTKKRIILSGTPFQNNFRELYNTLCLATPKFADWNGLEDHRKVEKACNQKNNNDGRGKWATLTSLIGKVTPNVSGESLDDRLKELQAMILPYVHVHKGNILQESLPGLTHSVVILNPTKLQKILLAKIDGSNNFSLEHAMSLASVHPSLLLETSMKETKEVGVDPKTLEKLRLNPDAGAKTRFLIELVQLCVVVNEKVLLFSQFLDPLAFVEAQLLSHFNWSEGKEVLYMHGKQDIKSRQSTINIFNDPTSESRVLLASTKACSEGINLVGASRVVLLDVVWNPSVERQAISRAYRLGQKKAVYVYHLITAGTKEGEKYCRQTVKDRLSNLVFTSSDGSKDIPTTVLQDKILEEMVQHHRLKDLFEKIIDQPKESNLIDTFSFMDS